MCFRLRALKKNSEIYWKYWDSNFNKKISHQSGSFWKKVKPKFFIKLDIEVRNHVKFEFANIALRAPNSCQLKIDENKRSITTTIIVMKTLFLSLVAWLGKKQKLREPFSCLFLFSPEIVTEEKVVLSGEIKKNELGQRI